MNALCAGACLHSEKLRSTPGQRQCGRVKTYRIRGADGGALISGAIRGAAESDMGTKVAPGFNTSATEGLGLSTVSATKASSM